MTPGSILAKLSCLVAATFYHFSCPLGLTQHQCLDRRMDSDPLLPRHYIGLQRCDLKFTLYNYSPGKDTKITHYISLQQHFSFVEPTVLIVVVCFFR